MTSCCPPETLSQLGPAPVVLLSCYELGHPPLGIAWPAGFLRDAGIPVRTVDLALDGLPEDAVRDAALVAVSVPMLTALRLGAAVSARLRAANPRVHIAFFGLYAGLNAEALLAGGVADSVLAGESEEALVDLARALAEGRPAAEVAGVSTRARREPAIRTRLRFATPERDGLPGLDRYARYMHEGVAHLAGAVEASRGCLHTCRHCPVVPVYGGRFFVVPAEIVRADIRHQVAQGARHISFGDPDFLNGPGHALKVARALHADHPEVTFDATIKVEHIVKHRELFSELAALGCRFVISAVESLSDRVLDQLQKGHTAHDVDTALGILDAAGIALQPTLVAFTPWTTVADYIATLEFFRTRGLMSHVPPVQLSIRLLVPPGSVLITAEDASAWLGPLDAPAFTHRWRHPDPRMDALHEAVASRVELAADAQESAERTWEAVRALAYSAADIPIEEAPLAAAARPLPPRLSEQWFCCAEPRRVQVAHVQA